MTLFEILENQKKHPGSRKKFGLVIQGGGMRGVYSAAALGIIEDHGFTDVFSHVVGSSAGAFNAAYFIAGQSDAASIYINDLTNKNFVNMTRLNKKIDVDYAVDVAMHKHFPLDLEALRLARPKLHVVVTNAKSGRKVVLSEHQEFINIYEELRATAAMPILYDKIIRIGRRGFIDGGVSGLLPVDVAIGFGCTDVLVLMTRQKSSYLLDTRHERLVKRLMYHLARKQSKAIRDILPSDEKYLKKNLKLLSNPPKNTNIYVLEPSQEKALVSFGTIEKDKIQDLASLGLKDMKEFLSKPLDI